MDSLFAVENAASVTCQECRRPIDLWSPPGLRIVPRAGTNRATFTDIDPTEALCPEFLIAAAPAGDRRELAEQVDFQRLAIREAGIGPPATVIVLRSTGNPALRWTRGFTLDTFTVLIRNWDAGSKARPHMTLVSDDASKPPLSFVSFAAEVFHDDVPGAYVRYVWPFQDITRPALVTTFGYDNPDLTEAQLATLNRGRRFLQGAVRKTIGRPPGSRRRSRQVWVDAFREQGMALGRRPTQEEFVRHMETDRKTLRANLTADGLWPWDRFLTITSSSRTTKHR